jgi:hypothetical protein
MPATDRQQAGGPWPVAASKISTPASLLTAAAGFLLHEIKPGTLAFPVIIHAQLA